MITAFYNIFIFLYSIAIKLAALWNPKARRWIRGRKSFFENLAPLCTNLTNGNGKIIWMHCASLGEFEQGRPLLEKIKAQYPHIKVVLSFFSPSGYEIRKNYKEADIVCYLPLDTPWNAENFIRQIKPSLVLWIRYEFWLHYLQELNRKNIPTILISGLLRKDNFFSGLHNIFLKKIFRCFTHFFVQTEDSAQKLQKLGFSENVTVSGDTRFDRVIEIATAFEHIPSIASFCNGYKVIVAGSTWTEDEEELTHYVKVNPEIRFIIAPHEVDEENIQDLQKEFPSSLLFSQLQEQYKKGIITKTPEKIINTIIIDNIGMLSKLYKYADITYVGGGFGDNGLHNILEAAVYGKPVFFGPVYERHYEAVEMEEAGGAVSIENALELEKELNYLWKHDDIRKQKGAAAKEYVHKNAGATKNILEYIYRKRLLTN